MHSGFVSGYTPVMFNACGESTMNDFSSDTISDKLPITTDSGKIDDCDTQSSGESAMILTDQLINFVMTDDWLSEDYEFTSDDLNRFLLSLCLYKDEASHPYSDKVYMSDDKINYIISAQSINEIASELFDIRLVDFDSVNGYDDNTMQCVIPAGIGLTNTGFSYDAMSFYYDNDTVCVQVELTENNMYVSSENTDLVDYILRFGYVNADSSDCLQINSIDTAPSETTTTSLESTPDVSATSDEQEVPSVQEMPPLTIPALEVDKSVAELYDDELVEIFTKLIDNYKTYLDIYMSSGLEIDYDDFYMAKVSDDRYNRFCHVCNIENASALKGLICNVFSARICEDYIYPMLIDGPFCTLFIEYDGKLYYNVDTGGVYPYMIHTDTAKVTERGEDSFSISAEVPDVDNTYEKVYEIGVEDGRWVFFYDFYVCCDW